MYVLELKLDDGSTEEKPLDKLPAIVGRHKTSSVHIRNKTVSREHARLFEREGGLFVADLNSSNGTFVNSERVSLMELKPGDEICFGSFVTCLMKPGPEAGTMLDETGKKEGSPSDDNKVITSPESGDVSDELTLPSGAIARDRDKSSSLSGTKTKFVRQQPSFPKGKPPAKDGGPRPQAISPNEIRVKQDILQYNRIDPDKNRSFLRNDFSQYGGAIRLLIIAGFIALFVGSFFLFQWLGKEVTPDKLGTNEGVERADK